MEPPPRPRPDLNSHDAQLLGRLKAELLSRYSLPVTDQWITSFLSTVRQPPPPLPALASTAHFRLLNTDFTSSLIGQDSNFATTATPSSAANEVIGLLPRTISDVQVKSLLLNSNIPVQVLDIEDIGASKWSQVEAIERVERGEEVRGREVIRTVPIMSEDDGSVPATNGAPSSRSTNDDQVSGSAGQAVVAATSKKSNGPHKLLLQDAASTKVYAFELVKIPKIGIVNLPEAQDPGLCIGAKILLKKGTAVRRGMIMLTPETTVVMGGKVEVWDKKWRETLKKRLADGIPRNDEPDA